ncbi:MAG: hypothetical protein H6962_14475 [Chromatiaceae bacterium]|nr:hypothetical protein [Chromatiaceae bacterium]
MALQQYLQGQRIRRHQRFAADPYQLLDNDPTETVGLSPVSGLLLLDQKKSQYTHGRHNQRGDIQRPLESERYGRVLVATPCGTQPIAIRAYPILRFLPHARHVIAFADSPDRAAG